MVEACGIQHLNGSEAYMPFIFCIEKSDSNGTPAALIAACAPSNTSAQAINTCFGDGQGAEGSSLIATIAAKTKPLNHQYTPWVVINGEHSKMAEDNLEKAICTAYKGAEPPAACHKYVTKRCYKDTLDDVVV